jgi:hypothetical protein
MDAGTADLSLTFDDCHTLAGLGGLNGCLLPAGPEPITTTSKLASMPALTLT